jgi:hypothetical protein
MLRQRRWRRDCTRGSRLHAELVAEQARHPGRAAEYADPEAVFAAGFALTEGACSGLTHVANSRMQVTLTPGRVAARLTATPRGTPDAAAAFAGMTIGDVGQALFAAPTTDEVQCVHFTSKTAPDAARQDTPKLLRGLLGERVSEAEMQRVHSAWSAYAEAARSPLWWSFRRASSAAHGPRLTIRNQAGGATTRALADALLDLAHLRKTMQLTRTPLPLTGERPGWTQAYAERLALGKPASNADANIQLGYGEAFGYTWLWGEWFGNRSQGTRARHTRPSAAAPAATTANPGATDAEADTSVQYPELVDAHARPTVVGGYPAWFSRAGGGCVLRVPGSPDAKTARAFAAYAASADGAWAEVDAPMPALKWIIMRLLD